MSSLLLSLSGISVDVVSLAANVGGMSSGIAGGGEGRGFGGRGLCLTGFGAAFITGLGGGAVSVAIITAVSSGGCEPGKRSSPPSQLMASRCKSAAAINTNRLRECPRWYSVGGGAIVMVSV